MKRENGQAVAQKTAGHTPGPWIARRDEETKQFIRIRGTGFHNGNIAMICKNFKPDGILPGEGLANARLIAAAPDLLEALQALVEIHQERPTYPPLEERAMSWEKARGAIAKAIGKE